MGGEAFLAGASAYVGTSYPPGTRPHPCPRLQILWSGDTAAEQRRTSGSWRKQHRRLLPAAAGAGTQVRFSHALQESTVETWRERGRGGEGARVYKARRKNGSRRQHATLHKDGKTKNSLHKMAFNAKAHYGKER